LAKRTKTRRQRYEEKKKDAKTYPISLCAINFMHDGNLGYLVRSAACFGAECVHVIGSIPSNKALNPSSGSLTDYVKIIQHENPSDFLAYANKNNYEVVSAELSHDSTPINSCSFSFDRHMCVVVGNEETGVPAEILNKSTIVHIPMPGVGYCLNTSQTANIMMYELTKQYDRHEQNMNGYGYYICNGKIMNSF